MAVNPKTLALLAQIARTYGPTIATQAKRLLDERPAGAAKASGPGATASGAGGTSGLAGAAGLLGGSAQHAFDAARGVARQRSTDGRLEAKLDVLSDLVDQATPGTPLHERAQASRAKLDALKQKRALILRAYTGRERARQLKDVQTGADELLQQFLAATDEQLG